jgi:hypothetical protein
VKSRFLVLIVFFFSFYFGQSQNRWENWNRFTLHHDLSNHWSYETEFQYRFQEDVLPNQNGFTDLMQSFRIWTFYTLKKHQILIIPFSFFKAKAMIQPSDLSIRQLLNEWRWSLGYQWNTKGPGILLRTLFDYRYMDQNDNGFRYRFMIAYNVPITPKLKIKAYEEWMANSMQQTNFLQSEQNRLGMMVKWEPIPNFQIETGYLWLHRFHQTTTIQENIITFGLQYQLP